MDLPLENVLQQLISGYVILDVAVASDSDLKRSDAPIQYIGIVKQVGKGVAELSDCFVPSGKYTPRNAVELIDTCRKGDLDGTQCYLPIERIIAVHYLNRKA